MDDQHAAVIRSKTRRNAPQRRIVLVNDSDAVLALLHTYFSALGYDVVTVRLDELPRALETLNTLMVATHPYALVFDVGDAVDAKWGVAIAASALPGVRSARLIITATNPDTVPNVPNVPWQILPFSGTTDDLDRLAKALGA